MPDLGRLKELEEKARNLGKTIKERLPPRVGFTLFLFDHNIAGGWLTYISSSQREDMIRTIFEFLEKQQRDPRTPSTIKLMIKGFRSGDPTP